MVYTQNTRKFTAFIEYFYCYYTSSTKYVFTLISIISLINCNLAVGQANIQKWNVGLDLTQVYVNKNDYTKSFSTLITPNASYKINRQLKVGIGIPFGYAKQNSIDNYTSDRMGIMPFFRYQLGTNRLSPYANFAYGILFVNSTYTVDTKQYKDNYNKKLFTAGLGLAYKFKSSIQILAGVNYMNSDTGVPRTLNSGNMTLVIVEPGSSNISPTLGINIDF